MRLLMPTNRLPSRPFPRNLRFFWLGLLSLSLASCGLALLLDTDPWQRTHIETRSAAKKVELTAQTRVALIGFVDKPPVRTAQSEAKIEDLTWLLQSLDANLPQMNKKQFAWGGLIIIDGSPISTKETDFKAVMGQHQLDLLIQLYPPAPPSAGFLVIKQYFDIDGAVIDRQGRTIATFRSQIFFHDAPTRTHLARNWDQEKTDRKAYYEALSLTVAQNLVKMLDPKLLMANDRRFTLSENDLLKKTQKDLPPVPDSFHNR